MAESNKQFREADMYPYLKSFLINRGFEVKGEVRDCDLVAIQGDTMLVVEMKRQFSTQLLVQAIERQQMSESVYIAIPKPVLRGQSAKWKGIRKLLRRLELGMLFVEMKTGRVIVDLDPLGTQKPRPRKNIKQAVLKEFYGRSGDYNVGGSNQRKVVTHYREQALLIASCLLRESPLTPAALRRLGTGENTTPILYDNVYGWFERVSRGQYQLTHAGQQGLIMFQEVVQQIERSMRSLNPEE